VAFGLGALLVAAAAATPVSGHPWGGSRGEVQKGMFAQKPIALPAQTPPEPPSVPAPRAKCGPGSIPEPGMQGRVAKEDVDAGRVDKGYRCNLTVVGSSGSTGGFRVHRYLDRNGHECAFYDTTLLFPTNALSLSAEPTGVAVLDMSNPAKPARTDTLVTPAMQTPHESLNISIERGLLAAVMGNPSAYPGLIDVYDISQDCRHPLLLSSLPGSMFGHESGMALDGMTFYPTSIGTGQTTAVDLKDPRVPKPLWTGDYNTHGMSVSDDGNRGYFAAGDGLIITDLSEIQARKPNPQVREISRLVWSNMTIPQIAIPVTIKGKPYLVEVDEFSSTDSGQTTAHGPRVGAARIIDVSDERKPFVVSNIRLQVHQPENRAAIANDYGTRSPVQGYAGHYCNVPQRKEPEIFACSMINSGLRVFDIRDPEKPKEIAYFVAPPSTISASGSPAVDERANFAMSQPAFAPERGEIWYSDGTSGFYALRMDPSVWPFPAGSRAAGGGCVDAAGLRSVSARPRGGRVAFDFVRGAQLPVRVDVLQAARGRRVARQRLIARFGGRTGSFVWNGAAGRGARRPVPAGFYVVRFTMLKDGRPYDSRSVVLQRRAAGFVVRPAHQERGSCGLLGAFSLRQPVFGGTRGTPLRASYRLRTAAKVTVTVSRGRKVVKRFATVQRQAGRTFAVRLAARRLPKGDYTIALLAQSGEDQVSSKLVARRL
jgi:hypothetical protein